MKDRVISLVGYPAVESMIEKSEMSFEQWRDRGIIHTIEGKTGLIHYDIKACSSLGGGSVFSEDRYTAVFSLIGVR